MKECRVFCVDGRRLIFLQLYVNHLSWTSVEDVSHLSWTLVEAENNLYTDFQRDGFGYILSFCMSTFDERIPKNLCDYKLSYQLRGNPRRKNRDLKQLTIRVKSS